MGDNEAEGQPRPPAGDAGQDETTGGPDTPARETDAPGAGTPGTGDGPAPGGSDEPDSSDGGGAEPDSIYGG